MFTCLFNCLLSFNHFLNMFCTSFGMDIFQSCVLQCIQYHLTFAFWVFSIYPIAPNYHIIIKLLHLWLSCFCFDCWKFCTTHQTFDSLVCKTWYSSLNDNAITWLSGTHGGSLTVNGLDPSSDKATILNPLLERTSFLSLAAMIVMLMSRVTHKKWNIINRYRISLVQCCN